MTGSGVIRHLSGQNGGSRSALRSVRAAEGIGRPLGDDRFLARIARRTGRLLKPAGRMG
jgi:hypothetical protein